MGNESLYWRYEHTSVSLSAVALCAALVFCCWFLGKQALWKLAFFFGKVLGFVWRFLEMEWGGLVCRFDFQDLVFLDIVCSEVCQQTDLWKRIMKQNMGNSFKRKGKMEKKTSFHWFSYETACIYRGILKILVNVLKLWGNIDLHNSLVKQFM